MDNEDRGRDGRLIPIQFRFVPKDVWLRMHIDTRSTIGSVKDAVLDRLKMPPFDPTIFANFYEEASNAMAKPALFPSDAKAFPKAFVARTPRKTIVEVLESDSKRTRARANDVIKSSPSKLNPKGKSKDSLAVAKGILGGEPGEGGIGSLNFVGLNVAKEIQQKTHDSSMAIESLTVLSSPTPSLSPSMKLMNGMRSSRVLKARASIASLSAAAKAGQSTAIQAVNLAEEKERSSLAASRNLFYDPTVAAGLDAYVDCFGPSGNSEAKRKEEEAMAFIQQIESTSSSLGPGNGQMRKVQKAIETSNSSPGISSSLFEGPATASADGNDLDLDYSTTDDESQRSLNIDREMAPKSARSSESDLSILSHLQQQYPPSLTSRHAISLGHQRGDAEPATSESTSDGASITLSNATTERGRSGTIIAVSSEGGKTRPGVFASQTLLNLSASSSDRPSSSSSGSHAKEKGSARIDTPHAASSPRPANRIAGIHMDEISSWKDAQHAMSRFYSVHSFSNGHQLEDWRTVAAFRLRPYELLEIQHANPQERFQLPRGAEPIDLTMLRRSSSTTLLEAEGSATSNDRYTEQFSEGWCYIFKRNSGTSKAQRAGLGVWKLRFIMVRGSRLIVYRKKPARSLINDVQAGLAWDLNSVECVFSERADGVTRPALMPIEGLCSEILTLSFQAGMAPASYINNETTGGWLQSTTISFSMRFISQTDHGAFFNTFARAHLNVRSEMVGLDGWRKKVVARATIAGRGGTVLPGRAGRRAGRNALARSRLRPPGVSRDYDDADRWSSHSESEEYGKVPNPEAFNYADMYASNSQEPSYELKSPRQASILKHQHAAQSGDYLESPALSRQRKDQQQQRQVELTESTSLTPVATTDSSSAKLGRSRGFSLARSARRVLSPTDSSSLHFSPSTPTRSMFSDHSSLSQPQSRDGREAYTPEPQRHSDGPNTSGSPGQRHHRKSSEIVTPMRTNSQTSMGAGLRLSQQQPSKVSPMSSAGRHRSHTVASPSTSPTNAKRVITPKQAQQTSSSSGAGVNFHWPFRTSNRNSSPAGSKTGSNGGNAL